MIQFLRKDSTVSVQVEASMGLAARFYPFEFHCGNEAYAYLLRENFQKKLMDSLQEIRREAYDQGWKEAKAKMRKSTWFSGSW